MRLKMLLLLIVVLTGCGQDNDSAILRVTSRDQVINVKGKVVPLDFDEVLVSSSSYIKVLGDYIVIADGQSPDKLIHLFKKDTFDYIGSTGDLGQGPEEIAALAGLAYDVNRKELQVADYGNRRIYGFNIDSVGNDKSYLPVTRFRLREEIYPFEYHYINDTLSFGAFIVPESSWSYNMRVGKWNMQTGDVKLHEFEYPGLIENKVVYDYSAKHNLIVECSNSYDLINYFDGNLNLRLRIMGPNWDEDGDRRQHFLSVVIYKDWIIASYDGERYSDNKMPRLCHIFDLNGKYIKTLDVGYNIWRMSVDEDNARLYFSFLDSFTLGYLDLNGILD